MTIWLRSAVCGAALLLAALVSDSALAARLISTASGNINATGTWSVIDTTGANAFLSSETANTALTTSPVSSSTFTPAASTLTAIGVKLASVAAAPSGTITVKLANSTSAGNRECTQTVNVSDLVSAATTTAEGGWIILTCAASPNGTDNYTIQANTSVATQVNLFRDGTAANWSRMLVTNGTQVGGPAAGDFFYVYGNRTGAGTGNTFTVTMNTTSATNYGNVANTLADPSISIGQGGTLAYGTTASTAYVMQFAGPTVCYNGGTFNIGTSGTPIPSNSSATLTMNSTVEEDTGFNGRNGCTTNITGVSQGRNVVKAKLTSALTGGVSTSLTTDVSTGWLSGDSIVIAASQITSGTVATYRDSTGTLSGAASGTTINLGAAVANSHTRSAFSYTSSQNGVAYSFPDVVDVVVLNRNVIIQGSGASTNGYLYFQANSVTRIDWAQFSQISGKNSTKRGIEVETGPLGTFSLTNFALINSHSSGIVLGAVNTALGGTVSNVLTIQNGVIYNVATTTDASVAYNALTVSPNLNVNTLNPYWKIDNVALIRTANGAANSSNRILAANGQFTNISVTGSGFGGVAAVILGGGYNSSSTIGGGIGNQFGPLQFYANVGHVVQPGVNGLTGTLSGAYIWHEQGRWYTQVGSGLLTIDPFYCVTCSFGLYTVQNGANYTLRNGIIGWDITQGSAMFPFTIDANNVVVTADNMELCPNGVRGGVTFLQCAGGTNSLVSVVHDYAPGGGYTPSQAQVYLRNTSYDNNIGTRYPTLGGEESFWGNAFVTHDCVTCTPVQHGAWVPMGFLNYDSAITTPSGRPSVRMTPRVTTVSGYISSGAGSTAVGSTLTLTTGTPSGFFLGDNITSNGSGFIPGTNISSGSGTSYTVNQPQSVCSNASPCQFQSYANITGSQRRMASAPIRMGLKVAVKSGQTSTVCVWVRPSSSGDAASPWGTTAVDYNADQPRLINRANPAMGVQSNTVLATLSGSAGAWSQLCGTTPTAPADGMYELIVDADQTFTSNANGYINIGDWSCTTNCNNPNTQQYWWNGVPSTVFAPAGGIGFLNN